MTAKKASARSTAALEKDDIVDGVVQLRFSDSDGRVLDISATDLTAVLQGLVELTGVLSETGEFGDRPEPQIRIRAPKEGSFILEAVVWLRDNPLGAAGLAVTSAGGLAAGKAVGAAAGKALVNAVSVGIRNLRGVEPTKIEHLASGDVVLSWTDGTASEVTTETWTRLKEMKRPTRRALNKILTPLASEADRLEVRDASVTQSTDEILAAPAEAIAERFDYLESTRDPEDSYTRERIFHSEAVLRSVDFDTNKKWRVATTKDGTRQATIEDVSFLAALDDGAALHKDDVFQVQIRETESKQPGRNASKDWALIKVDRTRRGEIGDKNQNQQPQPPIAQG